MEEILSLRALVLTAVPAAIALLFFGWRWRSPRPARLAVAWPLCVGIPFLVGAWLNSGHPRWPLTVSEDRFLAILLPAAILVECLVPFLASKLAWCLRLVVAVAAAPILLHGSVYLVDPTGQSPDHWTIGEACVWLAGLAAVLILLWASSLTLAQRSSPRLVLFSLALVNAAAGVTVLLSGYATGGPLGFLLAAVLLAGTLASLVWKSTEGIQGAIGIAVVGLFALVVTSQFFGSLTLPHALMLLGALVLAWLSELPPAGRISSRLRSLAAILLVAIPLIVAVAQAVEESRKPSPSATDDSGDYSEDDYRQFGR